MTTLKTKLEMRVSCLKQIEAARAQLSEMLKEATALLEPATITKPGDDQAAVLKVSAVAEQLCDMMPTVSNLCMLTQWDNALRRALADEAAPKDLSEVVEEMTLFQLANTAIQLTMDGGYMHAYVCDVASLTAGNVLRMRNAIDKFSNDQAVCAEYGIDFAALQAGDEDARKQYNNAGMQGMLKAHPQGFEVQAGPGITATQIAEKFSLPSHRVEETRPGTFWISGEAHGEEPPANFVPRPRSPDLEDDGIRA